MTARTHHPATMRDSGWSDAANPNTAPHKEDDVQIDTERPPGEPIAVNLEQGVPGLSEDARWSLAPLDPNTEDGAFFVLTSSDDQASLIVTDPWTFFADYAPDLPDNELEAMGITSIEQTTVLCAVTLDASNHCFYLNLLGPFVFHATTGVGRQIVLGDQDWPVRAQVDVAG